MQKQRCSLTSLACCSPKTRSMCNAYRMCATPTKYTPKYKAALQSIRTQPQINYRILHGPRPGKLQQNLRKPKMPQKTTMLQTFASSNAAAWAYCILKKLVDEEIIISRYSIIFGRNENGDWVSQIATHQCFAKPASPDQTEPLAWDPPMFDHTIPLVSWEAQEYARKLSTCELELNWMETRSRHCSLGSPESSSTSRPTPTAEQSSEITLVLDEEAKSRLQKDIKKSKDKVWETSRPATIEVT